MEIVPAELRDYPADHFQVCLQVAENDRPRHVNPNDYLYIIPGQ